MCVCVRERHDVLMHCGIAVAEGKSLKDEDVLQHLPVGTTATFYFRDLGAQISWVTVTHTHTRHTLHILTHTHTHTRGRCVELTSET